MWRQKAVPSALGLPELVLHTVVNSTLLNTNYLQSPSDWQCKLLLDMQHTKAGS